MPPPQHKERGQPRRRRLLTLPAVCPCESIAPAPLLASLVTLAGDVASRGGDAAAFPALRRGAGEAVRIAGLLLAFLEAICEDEDELPATRAAVLALSELHVALQKLQLLLGDLGRRGARLWVLMNAELAESELRVALGSVATAIDLLLLPPPPRGGDVAELARLVRDYSWRAAARAGPDADDALAARSVRSVLERFSAGATPDAEDAWLALRRMGIGTWTGCAEEAAFLESELLDRLDEPDGEEGSDLVLISGLLAFALYCRVVLFNRIDDDKNNQKKKGDVASRMQRASGVAAWLSPESLQCPITLELMADPVTVATGQTYDRAAIKRWVRNNGTCPVTGERLRSADLVPNLAARAIVEQFLLSSKGVAASLHHDPNKKSSSKHRSAVDKTAKPFGPAAAGGARLTAALLVAKLSSSATSSDELLKATYEARKLTKRNALYRSCLADAAAVPWLLHLLSSPDASVQDNAVAALLNLSKHPAGRRALVESGGVSLIVDAVNVAAKTEARQNAAAVLFYLSINSDYCAEIGRVPESVPTLVRLAKETASYRGRKNALVSMHALLQCPTVHGKVIAAGAVPVLVGLLLSGSDDDDLSVDAVALLARLAERPVGARAVLAAGSELVTRVVDLLGGEAAPAKEHCVALLASLGRHGGDVVFALLGKMPGLMPPLYALISGDGGSPRAEKKARWLVNEIHRHYEQRQPPPAAPPVTAADRVIRV